MQTYNQSDKLCCDYGVSQIKNMFGFFKKDPAKEKEKEYAKLMKKARDFQRNGDLKSYSKFVSQAEAIMDELEKMKKG